MMVDKPRSRISAGKRTLRTAAGILVLKSNNGTFGPTARPGTCGDPADRIPGGGGVPPAPSPWAGDPDEGAQPPACSACRTQSARRQNTHF